MPAKRFKALLLTAALSITLFATTPITARAATQPARHFAVDYAYWNPLSLVIRHQGWLEADARKLNTTVDWAYSAGSNKAIENLNANAIQIGSHAGAAGLVARANGVPIKTVAVFSQPEWASIVVGKESTITSPGQLKGKKIAAAKGTDPYFFLLQTLRKFGLDDRKDVEIVNLAHPDGRAALERGDVDAWAGLDPLTAATVKSSGAKIIYRNPGFNSYGVLSAREDFIKSNPDLVNLVLKEYERARAWIKQNPDDAVTQLATDAKLDQDVALTVLRDRTNINISLIPGTAQRTVLETILPTLVLDGTVKSDAAVKTALSTLYDTSFAKAVVAAETGVIVKTKKSTKHTKKSTKK